MLWRDYTRIGNGHFACKNAFPDSYIRTKSTASGTRTSLQRI
jgi:hypothetical protein